MNKKMIKKIVKNIDKTIKVKFAKKFECNTDKKIVYVATKHNTKDDYYFLKWYEEYYNEELTSQDLFFISLFHEVGHIMTYTDDLDDERNEQYSLIASALVNDLITQEQANNEYFKIPMELIATEWGRNYYKKGFIM